MGTSSPAAQSLYLGTDRDLQPNRPRPVNPPLQRREQHAPSPAGRPKIQLTTLNMFTARGQHRTKVGSAMGIKRYWRPCTIMTYARTLYVYHFRNDHQDMHPSVTIDCHAAVVKVSEVHCILRVVKNLQRVVVRLPSNVLFQQLRDILRQMNAPIPARYVLDIMFLDKSRTAVVLDREATVNDLWVTMSRLLKFQRGQALAFYFWVMGVSFDMLLQNNEVVVDVILNWHPRYESRYAFRPQGRPIIVYRRTLFFTVAAEMRLAYNASVGYLLYHDALMHYLFGYYWLGMTTALSMAALVAHVLFRQVVAPKIYEVNIRHILPEYCLAMARQNERSGLISALIRQHNAIKHLNSADAISKFLNTARALPAYGASYFMATNELIPANEYYKLNVRTQRIGLNMRGFHILRQREAPTFIPWKHMVDWHFEAPSFIYLRTFNQKYLFSTPSAHLINQYRSNFFVALRAVKHDHVETKNTR